jgi:hypothetical protein
MHHAVILTTVAVLSKRQANAGRASSFHISLSNSNRSK